MSESSESESSESESVESPELIEEIIDADTADGPMAVVRKRPAGETQASRVFIFMDAPGIRPALHTYTAKLAGAGFDVAVLDLYHREGRMLGFTPQDRAADPTVGEKMFALMGTLTDDNIQADLDAAMAAVGMGANEKAGTIGFCLGARAVARTLMRLPNQFVAGAMWHPSFLSDDEPDSPHLTAGELTSKLFIGIGTADEVQSIASHKRYFDAIAPLNNVELQIFEGADHGFTWPGYATYHQEASDTCFEKTVALFQAEL